MSFSDDDDDFYFYDDLDADEVYGEVDDLAEHTMHSPVLINANAGWIGFDSDEDDWLYESDAFYDHTDPHGTTRQTKIKARRKRSNQASKSASPDAKVSINEETRHQSGRNHRKRRRVAAADNDEDIPALSLGESYDSSEDAMIAHPTRPEPKIRWWQQIQQRQIPRLRHDEGVLVALLPDWRERLKARGFIGGQVEAIVTKSTAKKTNASFKPASRAHKPQQDHSQPQQNTIRGKRRRDDLDDVSDADASDNDNDVSDDDADAINGLKEVEAEEPDKRDASSAKREGKPRRGRPAKAAAAAKTSARTRTRTDTTTDKALQVDGTTPAQEGSTAPQDESSLVSRSNQATRRTRGTTTKGERVASGQPVSGDTAPAARGGRRGRPRAKRGRR